MKSICIRLVNPPKIKRLIFKGDTNEKDANRKTTSVYTG